ncbi:hypothetical protein K1719_003379 [Acacia pycnantha]|nr:hypothetical protein K1719_003379 [Acacia pycnantha]
MWMALVHPKFQAGFFMAPLQICKNGNQTVFDEHFCRPTNMALVILNTRRFFVVDDPPSAMETEDSRITMNWQKPLPGWVKVNVDGAVATIRNRASCGFVIRDHGGRWVAGASVPIGFCAPYEA